ncbi:MAG: TolC family protein [Deltaproteobacteria bacterium]|nr:TolC family protein [Deltaproteobacteria bacterium]
MSFLSLATIFALGTAVGADLPAATPVKVLSFADASRFALGLNPDLIALRYQEEAQRYRSRQALAPNNPVFAVSKNDMPGLSVTSEGASTVYTLSFTLGFPGKAISASSANRHQAEAIREQSAAKEIDLLVALSNNYVALAANQKLGNFLNEEFRKAQQLVKVLEKKYAAAQAAQADLLNAKVVVANLSHDLLDNQNDYQLQLTQFRNLIKKPGSTEYVPLVPEQIVIPRLKKSLDELSKLMLRNRHQLKSGQSQLEATQSNLTAAMLSPLPDLQLTGGLNIYHVATAGPVPGVERDYSLGIGIAVPIFFPFNELSGIQAATRDRDAAEAQAESQRLSAVADLQTAYTSFQSAQKSIDNFLGLVLPAAKASYELTLTTYSLGKADYFILNEARKTWTQAQKDMLAKQVATAQLFNQIVQQVGCDSNSEGGPDGCH